MEFSTPTRERELALLALERHVRYLEGEIVELQDALAFERTRAEVLESSYTRLEAQFDDVTHAVRGLAEASAPRPTSADHSFDEPYIRGVVPATNSTKSNDR